MSKKSQPQKSGNEKDDSVTNQAKEDKIKIEGYDGDVITRTNEQGVIEVEVPKGLEGESLEKFKRRAQQAVETAGKTYHERMEFNQERDKFNAEKEEELKKISEQKDLLDKQRLELQSIQKNLQTKPAKTPKAPDLRKILSELTKKDIKTWDEVEDVRIDDPDLYYQAQVRQTAEISQAAGQQSQAYARQEAEVAMLDMKVRENGYDPVTVRNFAINYLGMPYNFKAFEQFKLSHPAKGNITGELNRVGNIRKQQVSFVKQGEVKRKRKPSSYSNSELEKMTVEQLKEVYRDMTP